MAKKAAVKEGEERLYSIPLRSAWLKQTRIQRANKAIHQIQAFLTRHMHSEKVNISPELNKLIWQRGAKKPPAKVKIKARLENKTAFAKLPTEVEIKPEEKKGKIAGVKRIFGVKEDKAKEEKEEKK